MEGKQTSSSGAPGDQSDIGHKLAWRMGIAVLMIVGLLLGLALFDHFTQQSELEATAPQFTEPVPVARKTQTQPLTPAEPPAEPASETPKDEQTVAVPESSAPPVVSGEGEAKGAAELEPPPPPVVTAQPVLPRPSRPATRAAVADSHPPPPVTEKPAEPKAQPATVAPAHEASPAVPEPAPSKSVPQPTPPRLFSGYALQAGVFSDPRRAEALHARLVNEGIPATIEARVQVGPFKTQAEADAARARMKELGIDSVMLMPKGVKR
ncbi:Cell division protein [Candidatus Propionivibrio aalborgensis]|uniref:Cell division protein n=1 Tax=Candidatus Propionivibrio aalborgensis TaxID=1860101 RepID=A0A1A8XEE2_9RHOO|nr:SPOR domain-containing protein [Candidatus Propionivibrio aalborgensis]SBT03540.1 Cell division protein [Candidatus Propionivibrio aalborgensis]